MRRGGAEHEGELPGARANNAAGHGGVDENGVRDRGGEVRGDAAGGNGVDGRTVDEEAWPRYCREGGGAAGGGDEGVDIADVARFREDGEDGVLGDVLVVVAWAQMCA